MATNPQGDQQEDARLHPLIAAIEMLIEGTSCDIFNRAYQALVKASAACDPNAIIEPLPTDEMKQRLKSAIPRMVQALAGWLSTTAKDKTIEQLIGDNETKAMILGELIRASYCAEMSRACVIRDDKWTQKKNEIASCAAQHTVLFDAIAWRDFLVAVDVKSKRIEAKRKEDSESKKKRLAGRTKRTGPNAKRSTLYDEYVREAARSRVNDPPKLAEYVITAHAYLALASKQLPPDKMLKMENDIITTVALLKAAMIMPKSHLMNFAKQFNVTSEKLMSSVGTIVVHRPDDVKTTDIDEAVKQFLSENKDDLEARIAKWNPEEAAKWSEGVK